MYRKALAGHVLSTTPDAPPAKEMKLLAKVTPLMSLLLLSPKVRKKLRPSFAVYAGFNN
jgi:hypothetical protein